MKTLTFVLVLVCSTVMSAQDIKLPQPQKTGGMPLMEALNSRHSERDYSDAELTEQQLSDLLWAAFGYNRSEDKKRTAPSSMNHQEIQIYVTMADGWYLYDALNNVLIQKGKEDIRNHTGKQPFVKNASLNLVYVANYADNKKINEEKWLHYSYANVGFISQNVYLYCASEGLATVVRGWMNKEKLKEVMQLPEENVVILAQSVGVGK